MSRYGALTLITFIITTISSLKLIGSYAVHNYVTALIRSVFVCVSCEVIRGHFTHIYTLAFPRTRTPHFTRAHRQMRALVHPIAYIVGEIILNVRKPPFRTGKQTGNLWQQIIET